MYFTMPLNIYDQVSWAKENTDVYSTLLSSKRLTIKHFQDSERHVWSEFTGYTVIKYFAIVFSCARLCP